MQPVKKKRTYSVNRRRRPVAALLVLLALVLGTGGVLWGIQRQNQIPEEILTHSPDPTTVFSSRDSDEVLSVTVRNPSGDAYTIDREDGAYVLRGQPEFVFSDALLSSLLQAVSRVVADETLMDLAEEPTLLPEYFGFTPEQAVYADVAYTDGTRLSFGVGSLLPDQTPARYMMVEGDTHLYITGVDVYDSLSLSAALLHRVVDPALKGDLINHVTVAGENAFEMAQQGDEWVLLQPFSYPLSQSKVDAFLSKLENIRFAQYVEQAPGADLAQYGLSAPRRTVTLGHAASVVQVYGADDALLGSKALDSYDLLFACGDMDTDVTFYCLYRDEVLRATVFSSGFLLTCSWEELLQTAPFSFATNVLRRLSFAADDGQSYVFDLSLTEHVMENNLLQTDENGNILYDLSVARNGASFDSEQFLHAYQALTALSSLHAVREGYTPASPPQITIAMDTDWVHREVCFYAYDALHYAMGVDGVIRYFISAESVQAAIKPFCE